MKSWKKIWMEELDRSVPTLDKATKDMPIAVGAQTNVNGDGTAVKSKKPMITALATVSAVLLLGIILTCVLVFKPTEAIRYAFAIEINPAVTLTTDEHGNVTAIVSANSDADVVLSDEEAASQIGKPIAQVAVWYADRAAMLGFMDLTEKGSAVRISSCNGSESILQDAQTSLQDYFVQKGIFAVVVSESVDIKELSQRCGISADSASALANAISRSATLFNDRLAQAAASAEALQALYKQNVLSSTLAEAIKDCLSSNIANIERNAAELKELLRLYFDILTHKDNPALILGDYWYVKAHYPVPPEGDFAALMTQMENALAAYKTHYGVEISSPDDLTKASECYVLLSVEQIKAVIANFSSDLLLQYSSALSDILGLIGLADSPIAGLLQIPQNTREFLDNLRSALSVEFEYRKNAVREIYDGLQAISREDYDAFEENIINEYGSLQQYWDAIK